MKRTKIIKRAGSKGAGERHSCKFHFDLHYYSQITNRRGKARLSADDIEVSRMIHIHGTSE